MPDGVLSLQVVDVYGDTVNEPVDVFLRHQTLSHAPVFRGIRPARTITIRELHQNPQGLYRIEVDAPSYLAVSQFIDIRSDGPTRLVITLPVNKDRVARVNFPVFTALGADAQRLLTASTNVLSFGGKAGDGLYNAFDDIRRAGFLNLVAKAGHTRLLNDTTVLMSLARITEQRGDRLFAIATPELHSEVIHSATGGVFRCVPDALHEPPPGFTPVDSYKTADHYGNLQLTFAKNDAEWSVDMDIDDAQGFEHLFQVVQNAATGQPTHPYNIHEILIEHQEIDPGYRFDFGSSAITQSAGAGKG